MRIPGFKKSPSLPDSVIGALLLFGAAGSALVYVLPRQVSGTSASPPFWLLASTGGILILLLGIFLACVPRLGLKLSTRTLLLAFSVNVAIVIIKFVLAPMGLYVTNRATPFDAGSVLTSTGDGPVFVAIGAFVLYTLALLIISIFYRGRLHRFLAPGPTPTGVNKSDRVVIVLTLVFAVATLAWSFAPLLIALRTIGDVNGYLGAMGGYGLLIAAALLIAFLLGVALFSRAYEQAKQARDATVIASVFWLMLSIILLYHVMWVIFATALITIWPFKTVIPTPTK